jgi:hypothetical protein
MPILESKIKVGGIYKTPTNQERKIVEINRGKVIWLSRGNGKGKFIPGHTKSAPTPIAKFCKDCDRILFPPEQNIKYLILRVVQNDNNWEKPSKGRLGISDGGEYLQKHGFGHEDWNFNLSLDIDGNIFGYHYYTPKDSDSLYNICFANYDKLTKKWYAIGFYQNAEYVVDGMPVSHNVLKSKKQDLLDLGDSLGGKYRKIDKIEQYLEDECSVLHWKVKKDNVITLKTPIEIKPKLIELKSFHLTTPTATDDSGLNQNIFDTIKATSLIESQEVETIEYDEFPEGKEKLKTHLSRERNSKLVRLKKEKVKHEKNSLTCEVCGFDFKTSYGDVGEDFIEAHHIKPISESSGTRKTTLDELVLLCSNCHRMIHRKRPWITLDRLNELVQKNIG